MATRSNRKSTTAKKTVPQKEGTEGTTAVSSNTKPESTEAPASAGEPEPQASPEQQSPQGKVTSDKGVKSQRGASDETSSELPSKVTVCTVRGKSEHRRSGIKFTRSEQVVDLSELDQRKTDAIVNDPKLIVEAVNQDT